MTVTAQEPGRDLRLTPDRYSEVQRRTINAALELFAEHGVSGTSLQMIAAVLGVTKAAIYHQFKSKDALVIAVAEVGLATLETALDLAEAEPDRDRGRTVLLEQVIDLAVARRRWVSAIQGDPVMIRLLGTHEPFVDLMTRVYSLLLGEDVGPRSRMRTALVSAAIGAALVHPIVADLDDRTLRDELRAITGRLFDLAP
jgi:AcrR family transcriptional regulator